MADNKNIELNDDMMAEAAGGNIEDLVALYLHSFVRRSGPDPDKYFCIGTGYPS